jgi:hypothetical protein
MSVFFSPPFILFFFVFSIDFKLKKMAELFSENDEIKKARENTKDAIQGQYHTIARAMVIELGKQFDRTKPCPVFYIADGMLGHVDENDKKVPWRNVSSVLNMYLDSSTLVKAICALWPIEKLECARAQVAETLAAIMGVNGVGCIDASFDIEESRGIIVRNNTKSILIPTRQALAEYTFYLATKNVF